MKDFLRGKFHKKHNNPKSDHKNIPSGALWEKENLPGGGSLGKKKVPGGVLLDKEKFPGGGSLDRKEVLGGGQDNKQSMRVPRAITKSEDAEFSSLTAQAI